MKARETDAPRLIAFLRAINVGGRTVEMSRLRTLFASMGFADVETFIASGNVVFKAASKNAKSLERTIEDRLHEALGYSVAVFVRTDRELADIASHRPFTPSDLNAAVAVNVAFFAEPLDAGSKRKLQALRTDIDDFHAHGREIYWLCRTKQSGSTISNVVLEKALGRRSTLRGMNTIKRMAARWSV